MKVGPAWNTSNKQKHASEEFNRDILQISDLITGIEMKRALDLIYTVTCPIGIGRKITTQKNVLF